MILENILLALHSFRANKMRALLTMLGIIIGIASVIGIVTIGDALTTSVSAELSSFGTNVISANVREKSTMSRGVGFVVGGPGGGGGMGGGVTIRSGGPRTAPQSGDLISNEMIENLKAAYPDRITGVAVTASGGSGKVQEKNDYANVQVTGTNADYEQAGRITIEQGRYITAEDVKDVRSVCVVSDKLVANMFPGGEDPVGQTLKLFKTNSIELYTIVGVYKYETMNFGGADNSSDYDVSTTFYIPVTTAQIGQINKNFQNISIICTTDVDVISFSAELTSYFENIYSKNETWSVNVSNLESQISTITDTLGMISLVFALIAAISLLVGGIGVMNIMLVSVTERTREIGTRKALGAKNFHIRFQFVTEAVIISLIGGIIGIILGSALGAAVASYFDVGVSLSVVFILIAAGFSTAIGVFFGYYPANRAAKLDPIEALRYE